MNKTFLTGRITKTPETRVTTTGKSVTSFTLAVKRKFKNADGEYESDFINCKAFGHSGTFISEYCNQGDLIGIDGRIQTGSYTDKDGNRRYTTDVMVENVEALRKKNAQKNENIVQNEAEKQVESTTIVQNDEQLDIYSEFGDEIDDNYLD